MIRSVFVSLSILCIIVKIDCASLMEKANVTAILDDYMKLKISENLRRKQEHIQSLNISPELMDFAQEEAERLAGLDRLELPDFMLNGIYSGYSRKIDGVIKSSNENIGTKYCFGNDQEYYDLPQDLSLSCRTENSTYLEYRMGYGAAKSKTDAVYDVYFSQFLDLNKTITKSDTE